MKTYQLTDQQYIFLEHILSGQKSKSYHFIPNSYIEMIIKNKGYDKWERTRLQLLRASYLTYLRRWNLRYPNSILKIKRWYL